MSDKSHRDGRILFFVYYDKNLGGDLMMNFFSYIISDCNISFDYY